MARPQGSRSADFDAKRDDLLARLADCLAAPGGHLTGMRALAEAIGVTYPTLRHYFGSRNGILAALFNLRFQQGQVYLHHMADARLPFADSIKQAVQFLVGAASQPQFMAMHEIGLREGLNATGIGSHYLTQVFEPTLQAMERRLQHHIDRGEMLRVDPRGAALSLLSPLLLGALHQNSLEGAALRPLALNVLADQLADMFVRAYMV